MSHPTQQTKPINFQRQKGTRRSLWIPYYMLFYITHLGYIIYFFSMGSKGNDEFPLKTYNNVHQIKEGSKGNLGFL